jgi:hypothetical protein
MGHLDTCSDGSNRLVALSYSDPGCNRKVTGHLDVALGLDGANEHLIEVSGTYWFWNPAEKGEPVPPLRHGQRRVNPTLQKTLMDRLRLR